MGRSCALFSSVDTCRNGIFFFVYPQRTFYCPRTGRFFSGHRNRKTRHSDFTHTRSFPLRHYGTGSQLGSLYLYHCYYLADFIEKTHRIFYIRFSQRQFAIFDDSPCKHGNRLFCNLTDIEQSYVYPCESDPRFRELLVDMPIG